MTNKKLQEECWKDAQAVANKLNEAIVYNDIDDKFYLEHKFRIKCANVVLAYTDEYTKDDWQRDKSDSHLYWYYPQK